MSDIDAPCDVTVVTGLRRSLGRWYRAHGRELPWRSKGAKRPDPYRVLVSEAMLQQTQVATVMDYYKRFIATWPTVGKLAAAGEQQVLRRWQGLGYYRRALHLHAAAKKIATDYGGRVPDTVEQLLALPGVGRYTAGAIASIAFDRPEPILDGNVARVLARWFAITDPLGAPPTRARLWSLAEMMVPRRGAGDFNQALMDLGATVCVPRNPQCDRCPVARHCAARRKGMVDELPVVRARRAPRQVTHHVVAVRRGSHPRSRKWRYLFEQRPSDGLWSRMWQMPTAEGLAGRADSKVMRAWVRR
ncbi:MAG: A/G-specific adenine glycosylase, partial [Phycisphaeraceae bacterium]